MHSHITAADRMECMEVWGGNSSIERSFEVAGLKIWLHSSAHGTGDSGGDVYYISSCASGRITRLLLADVSGHGPAVAEIGAGLRDLMRKNINVIDQTRFVREMNEQFCSDTDAAIFATALVCTYFSPTRSLQFSNAGHPVALLYRASDGSWESADQFVPTTLGNGLADTPLGVSDQSDYSRFETRLSPGDLVLCVSDAFTEALTPAGQPLGSHGLHKAVAEIDASQPDQILPYLVEQVSKLKEGNLRDDDATALLFQADGSSPTLLANLLAPFRLLRGAHDSATLR